MTTALAIICVTIALAAAFFVGLMLGIHGWR